MAPQEPIYEDSEVRMFDNFQSQEMTNEDDEQFQSAQVRASSSKKIESNQIYNEPIYELTEENLSERNTPQKAISSPRMQNSNGKFDSDKSKLNQKD